MPPTNPLLSRVAEAVYWFGRYIERAENVARFLDVNHNLMLDLPQGYADQWQPIVDTTGDRAPFFERYGAATQASVVRFLAFDPENPNSIYSCALAARENARSVRETIPSEMWRQINQLYLLITEESRRTDPTDLPTFCHRVRMGCHLIHGILHAGMSHNEAWQFIRLGTVLERADKTTRILDVKYFILLPDPADVGSVVDDLLWAALLHSVSGYEMFRRRHGRILPDKVVDFLVLDRDFPRAIQYCLASTRDSLHAISGTPLSTFRYAPEKLIGQLCSDLSFASVDEIIGHGLHEYLDELQTRMNSVSAGIYETFFAIKAQQSQKRAPRQLQSQ